MRFAAGVEREGPLVPRTYTLTHSDRTGELFLTIGGSYQRDQVSGWYTRLMRDEVLAEWRLECGGPLDASALTVHCHVSGGLVFGSPGFRYSTFRFHLPQVLEAFRYGDRALYLAHPELDDARVQVRFHSSRRAFDLTESWGKMGDYAP